MRFTFFAAVCAAVGVWGAAVRVAVAEPDAVPAIIPRPAEMKSTGGVFVLDEQARVVAEGEAAAEARKLIDLLAPALGFRLAPAALSDAPGRTIRLRLDPALEPALGAEGYRLSVAPDRVEASAAGPAGLYYAVQTFRQLLPVEVFSPEKASLAAWAVPCVEITDVPRFGWRGLLIDPARHFIPPDDVRHFIDTMAAHKLNRLQMHLTDNEGWRIEIKKHPRLAELGSRMDWSTLNRRGAGPRREGFYTQEEMRELIRYAADRHVTIVPEIEMPYHAGALIVAYPEHGVGSRALAELEPDERWRRTTGLLGPREETVAFVKDVLGEVVELFPGRWIHIGGDEANIALWTADAEMQARMKALGCRNAEELHSWFIRQLDAMLARRGRRMVGWDEILQGGLAPGATVMSWRGVQGGITAAEAGHDVVMAPTSHTYFDYRQHPDELGLGQAVLTLEQVLAFEPVPPALRADAARHVLGGQGQLWGELIADRRRRDFMAWPRACALAEALWSPAGPRDFAEFRARLEVHCRRLAAAGVNHRPLDPVTGTLKQTASPRQSGPAAPESRVGATGNRIAVPENPSAARENRAAPKRLGATPRSHPATPEHARAALLPSRAATTATSIETATASPARFDLGAPRAAAELVERLFPGRSEDFTFETIALDDGRDVFEIETRDGRLVIRGNTAVSMAVGLNWYLHDYCRCHVSLHGRQGVLPNPLPQVAPAVRRTSWASRRYYLNYCAFGYSLPWWDWPQWEELIDWMALQGVNMPLAVTGQEAVWHAVCRRLGMTDAETAAFLGGPPYLPFQWMGCLQGWGGPLPADWTDRHEQLQQRILQRQRALGMTPVLQGFTGHVPAALAEKFPDARFHRIRWIEWETPLLDPLDPLFARVARLLMEEQTQRYGTDHLYAADTFIEMVPPRGERDYLVGLARAIHRGMTDTDPEAVWVLQGWAFMFHRDFWTQERIGAFLGAVPDDRMIVLDLFCESTPMWSATEAFCGKPWLWCNIQNFGNRVFLGGSLGAIAGNLPAARRDPAGGRLVGLGFVNEGLDYNPVVHELMFEMAWRDEPPPLEAWIERYVAHRYGSAPPAALRAWKGLLRTAYARRADTDSIIHRAAFLGDSARPWRRRAAAAAWRELLDAAGELHTADTYRYDLVHVARQALSDQAAVFHAQAVAAYRAGDAAALDRAASQLLELLSDLDELLATRREFLLGRWLEDAKRWSDEPSERARLEWNARRVLTLWGEGPAIDDYAAKEWSGMISGYYRPRWQRWREALAAALGDGRPFDGQAFAEELRPWMARWSDGRETYPTEPRGDSVAVARRLWEKYASEFKPDAESLTTGKPAACSSALEGHPPELANDGCADDTEAYWATDVAVHPGAAWWQVDFEEPTSVGRVVVVGYYGDQRRYGFTVETSLDGRAWELVADRRDNDRPSTARGYECRFPPRAARYLRVTQTHNSANTGRHLVEVMAYAE